MTSFDFHLAEYRRLNGSSYIELPEINKSKKTVVNMKKMQIISFQVVHNRSA